jgi:hypothetical protein
METHDMKPQDRTTAKDTGDTPHDAAFDSALRQHFQSEAEPDDDGFSQRVMTALPARPARANDSWVEWVERAQWAAMSVAASAIAILASSTDVSVTSAPGIATYTLIGLLMFWAIPSRWSRG